MNRKILGIIGIVLVILTITFFIVWNVYLEEKISTVDIITLTQDAHKNDVITPDMLGTKKMDRTNIAKGSLFPKDIDHILGQCATQYVPSGTQLFDAYFQPSSMTLTDDEQLVSIPTDWILAVPQSLRRGDSIYFYAFATEDAQIQSILEAAKETQEELQQQQQEQLALSNEAITSPTPSETITVNGEVIDADVLGFTETEPDKTITVMKDDILQAIVDGKDYQIETTVLYVKDSQNREITTVYDGTQFDDARLNGTGTIGEIEIKSTEEQMDALQTAVSLGYQFIIMTK
jgi:hypothetical protein